MSNYTEKTSGEQIKKMLTMLFGDKAQDLKVQWDNDNVGIRVYDLPSIEEIIEVLNECKINPRFVVIDNRWEHLTLWVCNHDGKDFDIED